MLYTFVWRMRRWNIIYEHDVIQRDFRSARKIRTRHRVVIICLVMPNYVGHKSLRAHTHTLNICPPRMHTHTKYTFLCDCLGARRARSATREALNSARGALFFQLPRVDRRALSPQVTDATDQRAPHSLRVCRGVLYVCNQSLSAYLTSSYLAPRRGSTLKV